MAFYHFKKFYEDGIVKLFDYELEGKTCPVCNGKGQVEMAGDLHKSSGIIPCPLGGFQGNGLPFCNNGKLKFSDYDKRNEKELKEKIKNGKLGYQNVDYKF